MMKRMDILVRIFIFGNAPIVNNYNGNYYSKKGSVKKSRVYIASGFLQGVRKGILFREGGLVGDLLTHVRRGDL